MYTYGSGEACMALPCICRMRVKYFTWKGEVHQSEIVGTTRTHQLLPTVGEVLVILCKIKLFCSHRTRHSCR